MKKPAVLFVDDEPQILKALDRSFQDEPYNLLFSDSGTKALEIIKSMDVHVIVVDLKMPEMDGLSLLKKVECINPDIIRLVLSVISDKESILSAINDGNVYRYINKPWNETELKVIIKQAVEFFDVQQEKRNLLKKLKKQNKILKKRVKESKLIQNQLKNRAFYDQMTNLPNRMLLEKCLSRLLTRLTRHNDYMFALLFMDLDRFKIVNDSLGHLAGDKLLIDFARRIETFTRPVDTLARFGGDEFALLLDDIADESDAIRVADRIKQELTKPFNLNGHDIFSTVSIGIAMSTTGYTIVEDIIRDADSALYRAKALGKARYEIFDKEIYKSTVNLLQLERDLWHAIERNEFIVYYQPIITVTNGDIIGAEALLRWNHPDRGFVSPKDFIPLAEETGLISAIGAWVLRTACIQNKAWHDQGFKNLQISVNFSAKQFHQQDILELVNDVLRETCLDAQSLNVEITESIAMETHSINILNELTAMGINTSIDDFGTGHSSLGSLKRFPINAMKIDKSFIKDITIDSNAEEIVRAIISMSRSLKMKVIAEGVETEEQLMFLSSNQCDEVQGYLFSRPVPSEEFTKLLQEWGYLTINTPDSKKVGIE